MEALARLVTAQGSNPDAALSELRLVNQQRAVSTTAAHSLAKAVAANKQITVCSLDCADATARRTLESALSRNMDARRLARRAAAAAENASKAIHQHSDIA